MLHIPSAALGLWDRSLTCLVVVLTVKCLLNIKRCGDKRLGSPKQLSAITSFVRVKAEIAQPARKTYTELRSLHTVLCRKEVIVTNTELPAI
jgi:hypothetical protein